MEKKEKVSKEEGKKWCTFLDIHFQGTPFISKVCQHPNGCGFCYKALCPKRK